MQIKIGDYSWAVKKLWQADTHYVFIKEPKSGRRKTDKSWHARSFMLRFHLIAINMFVYRFSSPTGASRISRLNDEIPLNVVEQVEVKRLHFAEFQEIKATLWTLFHVEIYGDITHICFYDDRHCFVLLETRHVRETENNKKLTVM